MSTPGNEYGEPSGAQRAGARGDESDGGAYCGEGRDGAFVAQRGCASPDGAVEDEPDAAALAHAAAQAELFARFDVLPTDDCDPAWDGLGEALAELDPGPELGALLLRLDQVALGPFVIVEMVAAYHRQAAWNHSRMAAYGAKLAELPSFEAFKDRPSSPVARDLAGNEVAMRLGMSRQAGRHLVRDGYAFTRGFDPTGEALETGRIDAAKARLIVTHLQHVAGIVAYAVQREVLPLAPLATPSQLVRLIQKALIAVNPEEAARRHRNARQGRRVDHPRSLPDGMASMDAVLPAADAITLDLVLEGAARTAKANGDERTLDQLRADALSLLGHTAHSCGVIGVTPQLLETAAAYATSSQESGPAVAEPPGASTSPGASKPPDAAVTAEPAEAEPPAEPVEEVPFDPWVPEPPPPAIPESDPPPGPMKIGHIGGAPPQIRITVPLSVALPPELLDDAAGGRHRDPPPKGTTVSTNGKSMSTGTGAAPPPGRNGETALVRESSPPQPPPAAQPCCDEGPCCLKDGPCCNELNPYGLGAPPAEVAELQGYGPISPDVARALALGGTWQRLLVDPHSGAVLDVGRRRYRPPAELAAFVRERDRTCVRPGCSTPAQNCDLDHTVPWNQGGPTAATNLTAICATDHAIKTLGAFQLRHREDAGYEWITPTGHRYLRDADGIVQRLSPLGVKASENDRPDPFPDEPPF